MFCVCGMLMSTLCMCVVIDRCMGSDKELEKVCYDKKIWVAKQRLRVERSEMLGVLLLVSQGMDRRKLGQVIFLCLFFSTKRLEYVVLPRKELVRSPTNLFARGFLGSALAPETLYTGNPHFVVVERCARLQPICVDIVRGGGRGG